MIYKICRFGTEYATATALPVVSAKQQLDTDPIEKQNIKIIGGVFSTLGSEIAFPQGHKLSLSGSYQESSRENLNNTLESLRYWRGRRSKLWVYNEYNHSTYWRYARLLNVKMQSIPSTYAAFKQEITCEFEVEDTCWNGFERDRGGYLTTTDEYFELPNAGSTVVRDIIITVISGANAITDLIIDNLEAGHISQIRFTGIIPAASSLRIDTGGMTVLNDDVDAFADFSLEGGHHINEWLRLGKENNTIRVRRTGGGDDSEASFVYSDAYA